MSKILAPKFHVFAALVLILQFFTFAHAQDVEITIKVKPGIAEVKGKFTGDPQGRIWFLDTYGELSGLLTERLSPIYFYDKQGFLFTRKRLTPTDIVKTTNVGGFAYTANLKPSVSKFAAAHASWASETEALLMLDDLLPQLKGKKAKITFELPVGWTVASIENEVSPGVFVVENTEESVFYLGKHLRVINNERVKLILIGDNWLFADDEAAAMAGSLLNDYGKLFGPLKPANALVKIGRFAVPQPVGNWEADTRGKSVTIVSSDMPFKNQSIQRLHEQLRHELFHLWVPGRLNLSGRYDWFYEGFALYQSLKTGVAGNQIRFEDLLNTLSGARSIDERGETRISLVELSGERWTGGNTRVYARGMLAAFATDLAMLRASNGKRSVTDLIAAIVRKHSPPAAETDANTAILAEFRSRPELVAVVDKLITGSERFDFSDLLNAAGLEITKAGTSETIKPVAKPSGKQKEMLKRLGSENWRNLR